MQIVQYLKNPGNDLVERVCSGIIQTETQAPIRSHFWVNDFALYTVEVVRAVVLKNMEGDSQHYS